MADSTTVELAALARVMAKQLREGKPIAPDSVHAQMLLELLDREPA